MALKQYKGPHYEGVELVVNGESYGFLEPGDSVAIPDEVAESVAWPEDLWDDVKPKATEKKGSDD